MKQVDQYKNYLLHYVSGYIEKVKYSKPFKCISNTHTDGNPSAVIYRNSNGDYYKCFGCDLCGDIFNIVGEVEGLPSFKEQVNFLEQKYGSR